jgi:hypothetical protein
MQAGEHEKAPHPLTSGRAATKVGAVGEDWFVESIDNVQRAAAVLHEALDRTVESLMVARQERLDGASFKAIATSLVEGGHPLRMRRSVEEAFHAWADAFAALRGAAIRALVDEEGMTFSEVGRLADVSRQMVARLYRSRV